LRWSHFVGQLGSEGTDLSCALCQGRLDALFRVGRVGSSLAGGADIDCELADKTVAWSWWKFAERSRCNRPHSQHSDPASLTNDLGSPSRNFHHLDSRDPIFSTTTVNHDMLIPLNFFSVGL